MNCLRKRISVLVMSVFLLTLLSSPASAVYSSISLSPSSGTIYADSTAIKVMVNSGSDEFIGVDVDLAFTGSVQYISSTGAARCNSFLVTPGSGTINIECLSTSQSEGETYAGEVATLYFRSTGTGTSTFTFSRTDPTTIASKTGGTYTLSLQNTPTSGGTTLPQSGIFDENGVVIAGGMGLILFGLFFNQISNQTNNMIKTFSGKYTAVVQKAGESRVNKRRKRLEKKF